MYSMKTICDKETVMFIYPQNSEHLQQVKTSVCIMAVERSSGCCYKVLYMRTAIRRFTYFTLKNSSNNSYSN